MAATFCAIASVKDDTLIQLLFIIPLILCFGWFLYLRQHEYTFEQGKQGFLYILIFSAAIALFYTALMFLTRS